MNFQERLKIREMYGSVNTEIYDPYLIDWIKVFSPIEYMAWCDIRDYNMRMWPQYPIGKYFADFANVERKIVIECDGKQWHDTEKDAVRDSEMIALGWTVYRITGAECYKIVEREDYEDDTRKFILDLYESSAGLVKAIYYFHYGKLFSMSEQEEKQAEYCLRKHKATGIINANKCDHQ